MVNVYEEWSEWSYEEGDTLGDVVRALMQQRDELKALTDEQLAVHLGKIHGFDTVDPRPCRPVVEWETLPDTAMILEIPQLSDLYTQTY